MRRAILVILLLVAGVAAGGPVTGAPPVDALGSWNDAGAKEAVTAFVEAATTQGSERFVPPAERIAVFDNDGTLWSEQPFYVQFAFAVDRIRALAPRHPEWNDTEPFKSILAGDVKAALAGGEKAVLQIIAATHAGMTTDEFEAVVRRWITTARHPGTGRLYTEMTYRPMRDLLDYLRAKGFKTYVVSGGGVEFMRPWVQAAYGIPPEQVIGSSTRTAWEVRDGTPVIVKLPELGSLDDGPGKPLNINLHIGRRPVMAFGNSDADLQMLQWTAAGPGPRFCGIVHHTDAQREFAYDRASSVGRLDKALDEARARGWTVIDMNADWRTVFDPPAAPPAPAPTTPGT